MGLEEVADFLGITKNISVINILLVGNPKHSNYWEILTLSKPKPGQADIEKELTTEPIRLQCPV